jgi:hypothetical protein
VAVAVPAQEIDLGLARREPARSEREPCAGERARGDALPGEPAEPVVAATEREEEARRETRERDPREPLDPGEGPQSFFSVRGSSWVTTLWIEARAKRIRTPSSTWSVTTSSWIAAICP